MILLIRIGDILFASFKKAFKEDKNVGKIPKLILENLHGDLDKEFELPIGYDDNLLDIKFKKITSNLSDKIFIKSTDRNSLSMYYTVDEKANKIKLNMDIYPEKAETVDELITILKIYSSFKKGTISIGKTKIKRKDNIKYHEDLLEYIEFWEKVNLISKKTNIVFLPSEKVTYKDEDVVKILYRNFIEDKEYKEFINIKKITVVFKDIPNKKDLEVCKYENIIFCRKDSFTLLNKDIELYGVIALFNFKINKAVKVNNGRNVYDFFIQPIDENNIFKVVRYFETLEEAKKYKNKYCSNIKKLLDAELL